MIKNYRGTFGVKILIYVHNLLFLLIIFLLSGYAYSSNEEEDKQIITSHNVSFPELSITEDKDSSLVATYQTADSMKAVQVPTIKDYGLGLQYINAATTDVSNC